MAIIEINPFWVRLLINPKLLISFVRVDAKAASEIYVTATQHVRRLDAHQLIVDDFPRTLESFFVPDQ